MTKKKGKLLTFCWSLIPGAGEMYLGFFKQGSASCRLCSITRDIGVSSVEFPDLPIPDCMVLQLFSYQ